MSIIVDCFGKVRRYGKENLPSNNLSTAFNELLKVLVLIVL